MYTYYVSIPFQNNVYTVCVAIFQAWFIACVLKFISWFLQTLRTKLTKRN